MAEVLTALILLLRATKSQVSLHAPYGQLVGISGKNKKLKC